MKKAIVLLVGLVVFSCGREKISERIIFPENYEGIAMVYYNLPDGQEEKEDDEGWKVIALPENGFLLTKYILPKRALYRREFYFKTKKELKSVKYLAVGDSRNDLVNFKGIDTTQKYIFSMRGGSYCCGERREGKGGIDFDYELFIYCKPLQFRTFGNKIEWNISKIHAGISQCEEEKLCYDRVFMAKQFNRFLR